MHSSSDKELVRRLHARLLRQSFRPWLDKVDLKPGEDWDATIKKAVRESDIVVVCLSNSSVTKEGYVQKEIRFALDIADEKPEGMIYIVPARLEECPIPSRVARWHCVDLFKHRGFGRLCKAIRSKAAWKQPK